MKKFGLAFFLVGLVLLGWHLESQAKDCGQAPDYIVTIGEGGDYTTWAAAGTDCVANYNHNLTFTLLANNTDTSSLMVSGYYFNSPNRMLIQSAAGANPVYGKWDENRFISRIASNAALYYAAFISSSSVTLDGIQFKRVITDDTSGTATTGGLVYLAGGDITLKNSFIWLQVPSNATFSQKANALKLNGNGRKDIENVVIFGDKLKSGNSGWLNAAVHLGNYYADAYFTNLTVYGRAVDANDEYRGFYNGILSNGTYNIRINNSYIRVRLGSSDGYCDPYSTSGDYNICSTRYVVSTNGNSEYNHNKEVGGTGLDSMGHSLSSLDDFECPDPVSSGGCGSLPDFRLKSGSALFEAGSTSVDHTENDIEGDTRPTSGALDVGVDEHNY